MATQKKYAELISSAKWEALDKEESFSSYMMQEKDGSVMIKTIGNLPCTPIEVNNFSCVA